jgi:segregation and condensation protein B
VIGRPILYKTTKEFLLRFGLRDVNELPSMEEFEKMLSGGTQEDLFPVPKEDEASIEQPAQSDGSPTETAKPDEPPATEQHTTDDQELTTND